MLAIIFNKSVDSRVLDKVSKIQGTITQEYGTIITNKEKTKDNIVVTNTFKESDFFTNQVNHYIETEKNCALNLYKENLQFYQNMNTYKVNDNIVGVDVIISLFHYGADSNVESTYHKCFNFNLQEHKLLMITDLFDSRYLDEIKDFASNEYVFKEKEIEFFYKDQKNTVPYKTLKNYNCSFYLNANNYDISEEEFKNLFEE